MKRKKFYLNKKTSLIVYSIILNFIGLTKFAFLLIIKNLIRIKFNKKKYTFDRLNSIKKKFILFIYLFIYSLLYVLVSIYKIKY